MLVHLRMLAFPLEYRIDTDRIRYIQIDTEYRIQIKANVLQITERRWTDF